MGKADRSRLNYEESTGEKVIIIEGGGEIISLWLTIADENSDMAVLDGTNFQNQCVLYCSRRPNFFHERSNVSISLKN